MARAARARAAGLAAKHHYGATHDNKSPTPKEDDLFESIRSIDTLMSEEQSTELSCTECCKSSELV